MRTIALLLVLPAVAAADDVVLKYGGRISGRVEERGASVVIVTPHGTIVLPRERVARIDRTTSSLVQDYEARRDKADLSRLADVEELRRWTRAHRMVRASKELLAQALKLRRAAVKGADSLYKLGVWARGQALGADALILFQEATLEDPDHEFARRALGYQRYKDEWLTPAEVNQAMGLILFEGEWIPAGARTAVLEARMLERERTMLEESRRRLAGEREAARKEYERRRAELESLANEVRRRGSDVESGYTEVYVPYPVRVCPPRHKPPTVCPVPPRPRIRSPRVSRP